VALAAALWAAIAVAPAEPGLVLRWEAPPGCPTEAEVRARVVGLVGEEAARSAKLTARGVVRADGEGWRLALELSGETGGGQRSLTAGRCAELAEAGALVVAIAVDPRAALAGEGVVPAPPGDGKDGTGAPGQVAEGEGSGGAAGEVNGETGAAGQVGEEEGTGAKGQVNGTPELAPLEEEKPAAPASAPAKRDKVRVGVRVAGGVMFAQILPRTGAAVNLALSVAGKRWRVEVGGLYAPPVPGGTAAIGGTFQLGAVELRGCPVWRRGRFEVPVCLGVQLGAIRGRGRGEGLEVKQTAHALWAAGTLGAALGWRAHERVGLWLQADAIVALTRPDFRTAGGVQVHDSARFGGQVLAGLEFRLR
jgi:hypothetical protein